jgi:hypothetical protein
MLGLAGCSTGTPSASTSSATGSGSATGGSSGSGGGATAPGKSYNADDLVAILKKAETTLGVKGTILDNAQQQAALNKLGNTSITGEFKKEGAKITPAACATQLDNAVPDAKKLGTSGGVTASLSYSKGILGIISTSDGSLPKSVTTQLLSNIDNLYSNCSEMKISVSGISVAMKIKKIAVTTDADTTYAYNESLNLAGKKISTTSIEAIDGNLLISMTTVSGSQKDAVAAINAAVAAAK